MQDALGMHAGPACSTVSFAKYPEQPRQAFLVPAPGDSIKAFLPHVLIKNVEVQLDFTGAGVVPNVGFDAAGVRTLHGYRPWQVPRFYRR